MALDSYVKVYFPRHDQDEQVLRSDIKCSQACQCRPGNFPPTQAQRYWVMCSFCATFFPLTSERDNYQYKPTERCPQCTSGPPLCGLLCSECNTITLFLVNHASGDMFVIPEGGIECQGCGHIYPQRWSIPKHQCAELGNLLLGCSRPVCPFCKNAIAFEVPCPNCQAPIDINDPDLHCCPECGKPVPDGYGRSPRVLNGVLDHQALTQTIPVQVPKAKPPSRNSPASTDQRLQNLVQQQAPSRPSTAATEPPQVKSVPQPFSNVIDRKRGKAPYVVAAVIGGVFLAVIGVLVIVALLTNHGGPLNGTMPIQQGQAAVPVGNTVKPAATGFPIGQASSPVGTPEAMNAAQQARLPQEPTRPANSSASSRERYASPPPPPRAAEPTSEDLARRDQFIETAEAALSAVQSGQWQDAGEKIDNALAARRSLPEIAVNSQVRDLDRQIQDNRTVLMVHLSEEKQMAANQEKQYNLAEEYFQDQRFPESKTALKLLLADATLSDNLRQKAQTLLDQVNAEILKRMQVTTSGPGSTHTVK